MNASTSIHGAFAEHDHRRGLALAVIPGVIVAITICWAMKFLIDSPEMPENKVPSGDMLDFIRLEKKPDIVRKKERPEKSPPPKAPPPPPAVPELKTAIPVVEKIQTPQPKLTADLALDGLGFNLGEMQESEYLPIVKVAPVYPEKALNRGLQGNCTVEYTVATDGSVKDVTVVESECDSWLFKNPSIHAALRFRYQPKIVNGKAVEATGIRNQFQYRLQGGQL